MGLTTESVTLKLTVTAGANEDGLVGFDEPPGGAVRLMVQIGAAGIDGAANDPVGRVVADTVGVPADTVSVVSGSDAAETTVVRRGEQTVLLDCLMLGLQD